MRIIAFLLLVASLAVGQNPAPPADVVPVNAANPKALEELTIPVGTQVPVALKHAISTKSAKEGDPVYAQTTFPIVLNDKILVPAGTYVQGRINRVQRAGRIKGRAEILIHFTTLIYPSGYTILLPGAVENVPGAEKTSVTDGEGTVRQDRQTGEKLGKAAEAGISNGAGGALIGGLASGSGKGAGIGAGIGGAAGMAIALLSRGADVRLDAGTTIQMVIQRSVSVDAGRIAAK